MKRISNFHLDSTAEVQEVKDLNLSSIYSEINKKLFKGKLPKIKLGWINSKKVGGHVIHERDFAPRGEEENWSLGDVIGLFMNNRFKRDIEQFKLIFVHEMIHVWVQTNQEDYLDHFVIKDNRSSGKKDPGHGKIFEKKRKELSRKHNIEVPRFDAWQGELSDDIISVKRLCILWETGSDHLLSVYQLKLLKTKGLKGLEEYCEAILEMNKNSLSRLTGWKILTSRYKELEPIKPDRALSIPPNGIFWDDRKTKQLLEFPSTTILKTSK